MTRQLPPKPDFDDALDRRTLAEHIEATGLFHEEMAGGETRIHIQYEPTLYVSRAEDYPNYRACKEHNLECPERRTERAEEQDTYVIFEDHGPAAKHSLSLNQQDVFRDALTQVYDDFDWVYEQRVEEMYHALAENVLAILERGYIDEPITRSVIEKVEMEGTMSTRPADEDEFSTPDLDFKTRQRPVTVGHRRLFVEAVQLDTDTYHQTERQAVEAYYDRCDRIQDEEMIAEDFMPYIANPPGYVTRYPEESRIPTYGEPVDMDAMCDELDIWRLRDLTRDEQEELRKAVKQKWPEEALV